VSAEADSPEVLDRFHGHIALVDRVAQKVARSLGSRVDRDDLLSFGREGLLDAARRFDPSRGVPFGAYATMRVRGAMFDGVRRLSAVPRRVYQKLRALEAADVVSEGAMEDVLGNRVPGAGPSEAEAALHAHLTAMATAMAVGWLAEPEGLPERGEAPPSPEETLMKHELLSLVGSAIAQLPDGERELVQRHYFGGERFDQIAADLGLSKSWASRLHTRAMKRLTRQLGQS
jgi:RNA polymerase sigma factor FliA